MDRVGVLVLVLLAWRANSCRLLQTVYEYSDQHGNISNEAAMLVPRNVCYKPPHSDTHKHRTAIPLQVVLEKDKKIHQLYEQLSAARVEQYQHMEKLYAEQLRQSELRNTQTHSDTDPAASLRALWEGIYRNVSAFIEERVEAIAAYSVQWKALVPALLVLFIANVIVVHKILHNQREALLTELQPTSRVVNTPDTVRPKDISLEGGPTEIRQPGIESSGNELLAEVTRNNQDVLERLQNETLKEMSTKMGNFATQIASFEEKVLAELSKRHKIPACRYKSCSRKRDAPESSSTDSGVSSSDSEPVHKSQSMPASITGITEAVTEEKRPAGDDICQQEPVLFATDLPKNKDMYPSICTDQTEPDIAPYLPPADNSIDTRILLEELRPKLEKLQYVQSIGYGVHDVISIGTKNPDVTTRDVKELLRDEDWARYQQKIDIYRHNGVIFHALMNRLISVLSPVLILANQLAGLDGGSANQQPAHLVSQPMEEADGFDADEVVPPQYKFSTLTVGLCARDEESNHYLLTACHDTVLTREAYCILNAGPGHAGHLQQYDVTAVYGEQAGVHADIAAIRVTADKIPQHVLQELRDEPGNHDESVNNIRMVDGDTLEQYKDCPVYMHGGVSGYVTGKIKETNVSLVDPDNPSRMQKGLICIESEEAPVFSRPGDSGAIVFLTTAGADRLALGMHVIGERRDPRRDAPDKVYKSYCFPLKQGLRRLEEALGRELTLQSSAELLAALTQKRELVFDLESLNSLNIIPGAQGGADTDTEEPTEPKEHLFVPRIPERRFVPSTPSHGRSFSYPSTGRSTARSDNSSSLSSQPSTIVAQPTDGDSQAAEDPADNVAVPTPPTRRNPARLPHLSKSTSFISDPSGYTRDAAPTDRSNSDPTPLRPSPLKESISFASDTSGYTSDFSLQAQDDVQQTP